MVSTGSHQTALEIAPPLFSLGACRLYAHVFRLRKGIKGRAHCQSLSRLSDRARRERLSPELPSRTGNTYQEPTSAGDADIDICLTPGRTPDVAARHQARHLLQPYRKPTPDFRPDINTRHRLPTDRKSIPDFRSVPVLPNPTLPSLGDTSPVILDKHPARSEVASRHPDNSTKVATHRTNPTITGLRQNPTTRFLSISPEVPHSTRFGLVWY